MLERAVDKSDSLERGRNSLEQREPPPAALLPGWRSIPQAIVRARGEEGYIDLVALHPEKGVALLAFLEKDEVADPEEARAAFGEMLCDMELAQHFPGALPIVALALGKPADALEERLERAFAGESAPTLQSGWIEWLAARLAPGRAAADPPGSPLLAASPRTNNDPLPPSAGALLIAPSRLDANDNGDTDVIELAPSSEPYRFPEYGMSGGFALGIVMVLLLILALFSQTGRLF